MITFLDFGAFEPIDRTPGIFDKGPRAMGQKNELERRQA
jgi:hypothetical protein